METMNTSDPQTWVELRDHPALAGRQVNPAWYDGDLVEDLALLRDAATTVSASFPRWSVRLEVLDDLTIYFRIDRGDAPVAEVYPSKTEDGRPCYFIDFGPGSDEIRVSSAAGVLDALRRHQPRETAPGSDRAH